MNITADKARETIAANTEGKLVAGKKILVLTPDGSRTCPLPMMIKVIMDVIGDRAAKIDFMVALGTHPVLSEDKILELYGIDPVERVRRYGRSDFFSHRWDLPETFLCLGHLKAEEVKEASSGMMREAVPVVINKKIYDYDLILILGPVFPHEVVGFSGGAKYLFPGISGGDFLHFFHWLGALITCRRIIGRKDTPVRRVIHRAMEMVNRPIHCISLVVDHNEGLRGLFVGDPVDAWSRAADLSAEIHIKNLSKPYRLVVGSAPVMYDELWTAGKVMYKLEQVVADGGELIIYAPHLQEISAAWGRVIERTGYHVRDYFLARMEEFQDIPLGVLAHSTHVRGDGTFQGGVEKPRIKVTLATSIPAETCRKINLGYRDPAGINPGDYQGRENEGILYVDHAGEILHRLKD